MNDSLKEINPGILIINEFIYTLFIINFKILGDLVLNLSLK